MTSKTATAPTTMIVDAKAYASVRGALAELGDSLGQLQEGHFTKSLASIDATAERVRPIVVEARKVWVNMDAKREASAFTARTFIDGAATIDDSYKRYAAGTPDRAAIDMLLNYCLHHSEANVGKYKSMRLASFDLADYCKWLPSAADYGTNGKLLPKLATAKQAAAKRAEAVREVKADTRMFGTDVNSYVKDQPTQAAKLTELLAIQHDVNAQIAKLREVMTPADKAAANKAFAARVSAKTNAKVEAKLAK